jgi:hypothetical protein
MNSNRYTIYPSPYNSVSVFPGFQQVWAKKIKFGAQGNKRWSQRKREEALKELEKPLDPPTGLLYYMDFRA